MDLTKPLCRGYSRAVGRKGIRNKVLVIYTVECSRHVCMKITGHFSGTGRVDCIGNEACAKNSSITAQLCAMAAHPNTVAVLVVGMGCEELSPRVITAAALKAGRLAEAFDVQSEGGTEKSICKGVDIVNDLLARTDIAPDTDVFWNDLCIGTECGSSDYTSLLVANPLVGGFLHRLSLTGGAAVAAELTEAVGLRSVLTERAVDERAAEELSAVYDKMIQFCKRAGRYSISPGNFSGGLTTIEEKSLGSLAKTGTGPISGVLKIAETAPPGLWFVDEFPDKGESVDIYLGGDASSMMSLVTAGCQLVILTTGRGHVAGVPGCPVIKLTGNSETYRRMRADLDFDASPMLENGESMASALDRLTDYIAQVAGGRKTFAEKYEVGFITLPFNNQTCSEHTK